VVLIAWFFLIGVEFAHCSGSPNSDFSVKEACSSIGITDEQFRFARSSIFDLNSEQTGAKLRSENKYKWHLSPQAYFNYLQYLEFIHSVKASKIAIYIAIAAIVISILLSILQVTFSFRCS
jgi:hypothetical protein